MNRQEDDELDNFFELWAANQSVKKYADQLILLALSISGAESPSWVDNQEFDDDCFFGFARMVCAENDYLADVITKRLILHRVSRGNAAPDQPFLRGFAKSYIELLENAELFGGADKVRCIVVDWIIYDIINLYFRDCSRPCPDEILELFRKLANPTPSCSIYDPRCNSAQTLLRVASDLDGRVELVGQSTNELDAYYASVRGLAYGIPLEVFHSDPILEPLARHDQLRKFDLVVSDLSCGIDAWPSDVCDQDPYRRFIYGIPSKSRGEYAYLLHMIASTLPEGRTIAAVNPSILSRLGRDADIRKELINSGFVESVIFLPPKLFRGDARPLAIMVISVSGRGDDGVLLINASSDFEAGKSANRLTAESISRIEAAFNGRLVVEGYSKFLSRADLDSCDFVLSLAKHFSGAASESHVDPDSIFHVRDGIQSELAEIGLEIDLLLKSILR